MTIDPGAIEEERMKKRRALLYGFAAVVLASAVIAFIGVTVGYGRGQPAEAAPEAVSLSSVQDTAIADEASASIPVSVSAGVDDDGYESEDEHEGHAHEEHEHEHGGIDGIFGDDD